MLAHCHGDNLLGLHRRHPTGTMGLFLGEQLKARELRSAVLPVSQHRGGGTLREDSLLEHRWIHHKGRVGESAPFAAGRPYLSPHWNMTV